MKVEIKTKSNYRNLNGKILDVVEIVDDRITCRVPCEDTGRVLTIDFNTKEIVRFFGRATFC